jgi:diacylglycerol kinase family enzyme
VAVLPGGSTNVFARTIGLPNDPVAAAREVATALDHGTIRRVGLGTVNGRYFTFHTGVGFDAAVVAAVERRASVKRWFGHPLFVWAGLSTWAVGYDRTRPHFSVAVEGAPTLTDGMFSIVMNTNPYTFLGDRPLDLVPGTGLDTALAVVTFRRLTVGALVPALLKALKGGGLPTDTPQLDVRRGVTGAVLEHTEPFPYQVDGDYLGETRRLAFGYVPEAVDLVLPRPA